MIALSALAVVAYPALAQTPLDMRVLNERLDRIEGQLRGLQSPMPTTPQDAGMAVQTLPADVASRLQVRVLQLERLVETLTGQLEQTQFEVSQMRVQLQQISNDVSYRLAVLEQAAGVSSAVAAPAVGSVAGLGQAPPPDPTAPALGLQSGPTPSTPQTVVSGGQPQPFVHQPVQTPVGTPVGHAPVALSPSQVTAPSVEVAGRVAPDLSMPMSSPVQPQPQVTPPAQPASSALPAAAPQTASPGLTPGGTQLLAPGETLTAPAQIGPVNQGNTFGVVRTDAVGNPLPPSTEAATQPIQPPPQQTAVPSPPRIVAAPTPGPVDAARIGTAPSPLQAMTALPEGTPQEQYDYAFNILRQADYARAETALRMFLDANPTDTLAGNAQYWLGETFYVRGDFEQAAVEFLSGYQTFPNSNKAPDNLLKLGLSMARLGQTDGACTALSRLATEYPEANDTIRRRAQTERARLNCS